MSELLNDFIAGMYSTTWYEYIAVVFGIASVWFSKREHILVFPVGLVNTIIYVYLSFEGQLFGEASVNLYYTIMSIYGWVLWSRKDRHLKPIVRITNSSTKDWLIQLSFFAAFYLAIYFSLEYLRRHFASGAVPVADAFASATAFTGMWLMARKKVESWYWWIATNIVSIPLYFVKGYVFTSVYYSVLLVLAFSGLFEWRKKARKTNLETEVRNSANP